MRGSAARRVIALAAGCLCALAAGACVFTLGPIEQVKPAGDADAVDVAARDASNDGPCDLTKPFNLPAPITALNTTAHDELWPRLTPDELTMVLSTRRTPTNEFGAYITTRSSRTAQWAEPTYIAGINAVGAFDTDPMITPDGNRIFFASNRGGSADIYSATRAPNGAFADPSPISALNTNADEYQPFVSFDGSEIWFTRVIANASRILRATSTAGTIGEPDVVPELTSTGDDWLPTPSADGLTLYFASTRPGGKGDYDIWVARRPTKTSPFDTPSIVDELNAPGLDAPGWLSIDGCRLYFHSRRANATSDLFLAEKPAG